MAHFESAADLDHIKKEKEEEQQAARDTGMVSSSSEEDSSEDEDSDDENEVMALEDIKNNVFLVRNIKNMRRQFRIHLEQIVKRGNNMLQTGDWIEQNSRFFIMETEEMAARAMISKFFEIVIFVIFIENNFHTLFQISKKNMKN